MQTAQSPHRLELDLVPDAFLLTDATARIEAVNRAASHLLGAAPEALVGLSLVDLVPGTAKRLFAARLEALRSGRARRLQDWQVHFDRPTGAAFEAEITVEAERPASDASSESQIDAEPRRLRWLLRDITERHRADENLRESMARARAILDSAVDGIISIDERGIIQSVNPAAERIFGYSARELVGRNVSLLMPDPERSEHDRYLENYLRTGERKIIGIGREVLGRREDGTLFPIDLAVSEAQIGDRRSFIGIVRDITERKQFEAEVKRLEAQMQQVQKLEAVGQLAGGIAHDFNTLLGSILGYAELLAVRDPAAPGTEDKSTSTADADASGVGHAARQIVRAAERGASLTAQLLTFSRRQIVERRTLDLNDIVRDMDQLLARLVPARVALRIELDREALLIAADSGQMAQVVMNLVVNACDAMPDGGRLEITTGRVAEPPAAWSGDSIDGAETTGGWVRLGVRDSGSGMSEEVRTRIFEPFFTTKGPDAGTGLGLATVYGIVSQSGGVIDVESRPNHGSLFSVWLPHVEGTPEAVRPEAAKQPSRGGSETILLVEDDEMLRGLLVEVLATSGYHVLSAAQPDEAEAIAESQDVDLLITDLVMPGISGDELARRLRRRTPQLRVLRMSGYTDLEIEPDAGTDDAFLFKPFSTHDLLAQVRQLLDA
ncbi:MAG: PAS domain S-box protein [Acidobacteriota bacterium]